MATIDASRHDAIREALLSGILSFLAGQDLRTLQEIRDALEIEIDCAGPQALLELRASLTSDTGWDYYAPDPLVRRIHTLLAGRFLRRDSEVVGAQFTKLVAGQPVTIFANHLSYADANVIEVLLVRAGVAELGSRRPRTSVSGRRSNPASGSGRDAHRPRHPIAVAAGTCRGDRRLVVDAIGLAVAELLPNTYRGVYADRDHFANAADVLLDARQGAK
jgi:hypothetical protein